MYKRQDVEACCAAWPEPEIADKVALDMFVGTDFPTIALQETKAKYVTREPVSYTHLLWA